MSDPIVLDTSVLGVLVHPNTKPNKPIAEWFVFHLSRGREFILPEISDYELRRELIRAKLNESISKLDELKSTIKYMPITTSIMLKSAELWAYVRNTLGKPMAHDKALDGDIILAAQAIEARGIVATTNLAHLQLITKAENWNNI